MRIISALTLQPNSRMASALIVLKNIMFFFEKEELKKNLRLLIMPILQQEICHEHPE